MKIERSIKVVLTEAASLLEGKNNVESAVEAELLLQHATGKNREYLIAHRDELISSALYKYFIRLIGKRNEGYSIAAITGEKYFYSRRFAVDDHVLIPRPETEIMVEKALEIISGYQNPLIIDVGTGSGCIIITIAAELFKSGKDSLFLAGDISSEALKMAKKNRKNLIPAQSIVFKKGGLLSPFLKIIKDNPRKDILILANLPYLTASQIKDSPSIKKEPYSALYGGKNGFELYDQLLMQVKATGIAADIILEIDPIQADLALKEIGRILPGNDIEIIHDYSRNKRHILIRKPISI